MIQHFLAVLILEVLSYHDNHTTSTMTHNYGGNVHILIILYRLALAESEFAEGDANRRGIIYINFHKQIQLLK